jgi:hypothetical protein
MKFGRARLLPSRIENHEWTQMHANKPAVAVGLEGRSVLRDFASPKAGTANVKLAIDLRALRNFAKLNKRPIFVCICVPSWFNLNVYSWFTIRLGRSLALPDLRPLFASICVHSWVKGLFMMSFHSWLKDLLCDLRVLRCKIGL